MMTWIMGLVMALVFISGISGMTTQPAPVAHHAPDYVSVDQEWQEYYAEAYADYADEFTALFNGYETRWAKNGRLMLRNGDSGPYKFVKRSK